MIVQNCQVIKTLGKFLWKASEKFFLKRFIHMFHHIQKRVNWQRKVRYTNSPNFNACFSFSVLLTFCISPVRLFVIQCQNTFPFRRQLLESNGNIWKSFAAVIMIYSNVFKFYVCELFARFSCRELKVDCVKSSQSWREVN